MSLESYDPNDVEAMRANPQSVFDKVIEILKLLPDLIKAIKDLQERTGKLEKFTEVNIETKEEFRKNLEEKLKEKKG